MIKDSGQRREFPTGAMRDIHEGKGRCDLLPLRIIGERMGWKVLIYIEDYIRTGAIPSLWFALEELIGTSDEDWADALLEVSIQYEEGARKYSERNWEKGIPVHCFLDSAVRHYLKWLRGDKDEPHWRAIIWNLLGAIWTHQNHPELIDLPFVEKKEETSNVNESLS